MNNLVELKNLSKEYNINSKKKFFAVSDVSFNIRKGTTLGLVGESGCGKTTIGRLILKLIKPTKGNIFYSGNDITDLRQRDFIQFRKNIQMVFQDPYSSLNPRMKIGKLLKRPLVNFYNNYSERDIMNILREVGMNENDIEKYPHQFSGGQRQRIAIARALIVNPEFLVLDEPTSSLDVSVQAKIMNLLQSFKDKKNITYLFISHDLSIIRMISDRIIVMYAGKILERADSEDIFNNPLHPYTEKLLSSVPEANPSKKFRFKIEVSDYGESSQKGCPYYDRCEFKMDICEKNFPEEIILENGHSVNCYKYL